jgi:demethylmenaquinone methyltransferase/2-methoxy-6-polyprenyl-1,4-benzoquinol methylase
MPFQLPSAEEKAAYVERQFDRIAFRYDLANDCISFGMHRLWKKKAIAQLKIKPGGKYLDVCCGSGDLALRIAEQCGPGSSVTGFDFSQKMLDVAANRSRNSTIARAREISWLRGDAQNLPFADNTFDGAIISFGLRNLTDLQKGINELARVVKPGARVVNLDLGHPTAPLFTPLYFFFFRHIVPIIGSVLQGDRAAYTYLPTSLDTYPKPDGITKLFENANLEDVDYEPLAVGSVALHSGIKRT